MEYVERYLRYVMTSVQTQLYGNGGPIIMVQVRQMLIIYTHTYIYIYIYIYI